MLCSLVNPKKILFLYILIYKIMKKIFLLILVCSIFSANFLFSQQDFQGISGINATNYPRVDGSTSTNPLNYIVAAKLLDAEYEWISGTGGRDVIIKNNTPDLRWTIKCSQTHQAIINLIDNQTDLIIVARKMSADEREHADNTGVSLTETPIALDALDFILNTQNPVSSMSVEQIQNIYLKNITNWNEVGGTNEEIVPFIRNANSGSQEMMNEIVMNGMDMSDWEVSYSDDEHASIWSMFAVYEELLSHPNGICFTPHYYKEYMMRNIFTADKIKTLAVNGIMADRSSIKNNEYPFVANVYVSIRSDLDQNSMAYKLYEWLQTQSGKSVIDESGYVPYGKYETNIVEPKANNKLLYPNPVGDWLTIPCNGENTRVEIYDLKGTRLLNKTLSGKDVCQLNVSFLSAGVYMVNVGGKMYKIIKK